MTACRQSKCSWSLWWETSAWQTPSPGLVQVSQQPAAEPAAAVGGGHTGTDQRGFDIPACSRRHCYPPCLAAGAAGGGATSAAAAATASATTAAAAAAAAAATEALATAAAAATAGALAAAAAPQ